jgi:competence protein ComEC
MTMTVGEAVPERLVLAPAEPAPMLMLPPALRPRALPWQAFAASFATAIEHRRLFLLWPYAVIGGLTVSLATPTAPDPMALGMVGAALAIGLVLGRGQLALFRALTIVVAFWAGFSLLAIHAALFGTTMLARPAYGTYEMRVDEIVSEAESGVRAIVTAITPTDTSRAVPMRRARIVVTKSPPLAPGDIIRAPVRFYAVPGPVVPSSMASAPTATPQARSKPFPPATALPPSASSTASAAASLRASMLICSSRPPASREH